MSEIRVLVLNSHDRGGGAERISSDLCDGLVLRRHTVKALVRTKSGDASYVEAIDPWASQNTWRRFCHRVAQPLRPLGRLELGFNTMANILETWLADPRRSWLTHLGYDDHEHPEIIKVVLAELPKFDLLHCHSLLGGYFDLRSLADLSHRLPTVVTLHDQWLFTGHCEHSFECDRWQRSCGQCPHLDIPWKVSGDRTEANLKLKANIYKRSRLYVTAPSKWLLDRAERSILAPAIAASKVIPNGVDQTIFSLGNRAEARSKLGLPLDADIVMFVATSIVKNPFKDMQTVKAAIEQVACRHRNRKLLLLAVGAEKERSVAVGSNAEIRHVKFVREPVDLADYYRSADLYIHGAKAENFPTTVLEALSCGLPVVASRVGGIPEQIIEGKTGLLVPAGDATAMADAITEVLDSDARRSAMANAAAEDAKRFALSGMVAAYLEFYEESVSDHRIWQQNNQPPTTLDLA